MQRQLKSAGFSAIEAGVVIVVLAAIGLAGGYVWHHHKVKKSTPPVHKAATSNSPWATFTSQQYGFKFSYPKSWGKVTISADPSKTKSGHAYDVAFGGGYGKVAGGFITKDWAPANGADTASILGFTAYDGCAAALESSTQVFLYKAADACVSVTGSVDTGGEGAPGQNTSASIVAEKKFSKNGTIAGVEFSDAPVAVDNLNTSTLQKAFDYNSVDSGFVEIAKSLQEL